MGIEITGISGNDELRNQNDWKTVSQDHINEWNKPLQEFTKSHEEWIQSRLVESEVIYSLPQKLLDHRIKSLFQISESEIRAEQDFSLLCSSTNAIGIVRGEFIRYRWLQPRIASVSALDPQITARLGWTEDQLECAAKETDARYDLDERISSAAGRLTCSPAFLAEREELKRLWKEIPLERRPWFPFFRTQKAESIDKLQTGFSAEVSEVDRRVGNFFGALNRFCDRWRITGFASWELPEIDGPKWPNDLSIALKEHDGPAPMDTPFHFPTKFSDPIGQILRENHRSEMNERGINDQSSWLTYQELFQIDFWENVIISRYASKSNKGFVTRMTSFIAYVVELDIDRVKKLRTVISAFKQGKRSSLRGFR